MLENLKMQLNLTSLDEFWGSKKNNSVFLGEWCKPLDLMTGET